MNPNKLTMRGVIIWLICAAFFLYEFILRTVLGTFQLSIMEILQISPVQFAVLSSTAYQLIYGAMQLPVGIITDKFGLKRSLVFAVSVCAIANFGFAYTHAFGSALFFRVMMGFGSSFGFVCLLVAVYEWMPRQNTAFYIGLSQFIGTMGPMLAAGPLSILIVKGYVSFNGFFVSLGFIAIVLTVLIFGVVDNRRESTGRYLILTHNTSTFDRLFQLIKQKQVWFIAIFSACTYFSLEYLSENECTSFLMTKGFSYSFSSSMITLAWLGYAFGCPLMGYFSDHFQKRKPFMILGGILGFIGVTGMIYFPPSHTVTSVFFVLMGIGASAQSIAFAIVAEYCKEQNVAIGLAFNNGTSMLIAASNAPVIGYILSKVSTGPQHFLSDYKQAFIILIIMTFSAIIISTFLIKETFCKSKREYTLLRPAEG